MNKPQIGDKVRVLYHQCQWRTALIVDEREEMKYGVIRRYHFALRFIDWPDYITIECDEFGSNLELLERNCSIILGLDYPMFEYEWREIILHDLEWQFNKIDFTYEGYSNYPTFLAALYLNNESKFHNNLKRLRRKDGSINPNKVEQQFKDLRLKIEDEAYEIPMIFPDGYWALKAEYAPRVNWKEVADAFHVKNA